MVRLRQLLGNTDVSADVLVRHSDQKETPPEHSAELALTRNHVRLSMDATTFPDLPPEQKKAMKMINIHKVMFDWNLDEKMSYTIFPGVAAYIKKPIPPSEMDKIQRALSADIKKTLLAETNWNDTKVVIYKAVASDDSTQSFTLYAYAKTAQSEELPARVIVDAPDYQDVVTFKKYGTQKLSDQLFAIPSFFRPFKNQDMVIAYAKEVYKLRQERAK